MELPRWGIIMKTIEMLDTSDKFCIQKYLKDLNDI